MGTTLVFPVDWGLLTKEVTKKGYQASKSFANDASNPLFDKTLRKAIFKGAKVDQLIEDANNNFSGTDASYALYDFLFEMFAGKIKGYTFSNKKASETHEKLGKYGHLFVKMGMMIGLKLFPEDQGDLKKNCQRLEELYGFSLNFFEQNKLEVKNHLCNVYDSIQIGLQVVSTPNDISRYPGKTYDRGKDGNFAKMFGEFGFLGIFTDLSKFSVGPQNWIQSIYNSHQKQRTRQGYIREKIVMTDDDAVIRLINRDIVPFLPFWVSDVYMDDVAAFSENNMPIKLTAEGDKLLETYVEGAIQVFQSKSPDRIKGYIDQIMLMISLDIRNLIDLANGNLKIFFDYYESELATLFSNVYFLDEYKVYKADLDILRKKNIRDIGGNLADMIKSRKKHPDLCRIGIFVALKEWFNH